MQMTPCLLILLVARLRWKIGVILLNKLEIGDSKYSKISNNCARFESNTDVTIRFD